MAQQKPIVVVIGAGIAGLAAAKTLIEDGGVEVIVVEALDRIGGRIHTQKYNDRHIELGAQWLHGERGNPLHEIAVNNDLLDREYMYDTDLEVQYLTQDGRQIPYCLVKQMETVVAALFTDAEKFYRCKIPIDPSINSMGEFLRQGFEKHLANQDDSSVVIDMKESLFNNYLALENIENGCDNMYEMSLEAWGTYDECEGHKEVNMRDGFGSVVQAICSSIPDDSIRLRTPVKLIKWPLDERTKVVIDDSENSVIEADHVIVTSSIGFLKEKADEFFQPSLPSAKLSALSRIRYGVVDKLVLEFEEPFWSKDLDSIQLFWIKDQDFVLEANKGLKFEEEGDEFWYKEIPAFDTLDTQPNLLLGWISGRGARVMETLPAEVVRDACMELLAKFTNNRHVPKPVTFQRTTWYSNPYMRGSYSYCPINCTEQDYTEMANPLPTPENPRLLFAGEGTHATYFSTTHGAYLSGIREADRILDFYRK